MKLIIIRIILILLILSVIGLFAYAYLSNQVPSTSNLVRGGLIISLCIIGLLRTITRRRKSLTFYEQQYSDILHRAFEDQPYLRKKLLCAVRLYNEDKFDKALKYLTDLRKYANTKYDTYCVDLFAALCFTDFGIYDQAIRIYKNIICKDNADSRIFSNLGHVQMKIGEYDNALQNYQRALDYDRNNPYAYNNIAQAYFQMYEFANAIEYAKMSLSINSKFRQASTLLAVIYALSDDKDNAEKYFHIAISSGMNPKELKDTIDYYRSAQHAVDEENAT